VTSGRGLGSWWKLLYLVIPALAVAGILAIPPVPVPYQAKPEKNNAVLDSERRSSFLICLEETGGEENICLEKLGLFAWYPGDEAECAEIAERIDAVFAVEGLPRWPALFRNERCARLGMPHNNEAAAAGTAEFDDRSYVDCYNIDYMVYTCDDLYGRHKRFRGSDKECRAIGNMAAKHLLWEMVFENERCWRLGMPHGEPD